MVGGYFTGVKGLEQLQHALDQVPHGLRDLSRVHKKIAKLAEDRTKADVVVYKGQHSRATQPNRPGHDWAGTGHLKSTIKGRGGRDRATLKIGDAKSGYLVVQMFGGTAYWHGGGAGAYRKLNRGHAAFERTGRGTFRMGKISGRGHAIYRKPRQARGYFAWNVAYQLRTPIAKVWTSGVGDIIKNAGLEVNMASNYDLGIKQQSWGGVL